MDIHTRHAHRVSSLAGLLVAILASSPHGATNQFRGVNWSDQRDNFQPGVLYLSGLSSTDTYASASIVAERVIGQFVSKLGTNSVRLPINEATATTYWSTYTGVIDVALTKGRVVLCYWGPGHSKAPGDMTKWWSMWNTVMAKYAKHPNFHVEVFNEPDMYSKTQLLDLYAQWLAKFPDFPRERIILDGTGLAMNVPDVGSDSRFAKCLLAVHEYTMFGPTTWTSESQWTSHFKGLVGNYASRTVATEWGGPMSTGSKNGITYQPMDYNVQGTNFFEAYMRAITQQLRDWKMGSFYWPGLRDNDWYSLTKRTGSGANIELTVSNQSGIDRLHHSWTDTVPEAIGEHRDRMAAMDPRTTRAHGRITVAFTATRSGTSTIRMMRLDGTRLGERTLPTTAGERRSITLESSSAPDGLVLVELRTDGERVATWSSLPVAATTQNGNRRDP